MLAYLGGPISGLLYEDAIAWRRKVRRRLRDNGIDCLVPLQRERALRGTGQVIDPRGHPDTPGCSGAKVFWSDYAMLNKADVVLANLMGVRRASVGTVWELGYAFARGTPIYAAVQPGGPHDHLFLNNSCVVCDDLDEAVRAIIDWRDWLDE
jgi:nucleoside 2-deoxyribosyltransferase